MKLTFITGIILILLVTPGYVMPWLSRNDSGDDLVCSIAYDIAFGIAEASDIESLQVASIERDYGNVLQFALMSELRSIEGLVVVAGNTDKSETQIEPIADAVLTARITRNESLRFDRLMSVNAMLISTSSREVLWSSTWRGTIPMSKPEWEFNKTALLICLSLAAGIIVIYARQSDWRGTICSE
ncbi:hypothetical protein ACFL1X_05335 [Candidatus Hydrogenedentota bacterium]